MRTTDSVEQLAAQTDRALLCKKLGHSKHYFLAAPLAGAAAALAGAAPPFAAPAAAGAAAPSAPSSALAAFFFFLRASFSTRTFGSPRTLSPSFQRSDSLSLRTRSARVKTLRLEI